MADLHLAREAISSKMTGFMAEPLALSLAFNTLVGPRLGWSDPMEFHLAHPVTVDPKVTSAPLLGTPSGRRLRCPGCS